MALDIPHLLVMQIFCMMHQIQLCIAKQLTRSGTYLGNLGCIINLWRQPNNRHRLARSLTRLHGAAAADRLCGRLPPAPVKSRWGSVHATEERLLQGQRQELHEASRAQGLLRSVPMSSMLVVEPSRAPRRSQAMLWRLSEAQLREPIRSAALAGTWDA